MNECGATLAWEYWHYKYPSPYLLQFIKDRDLGYFTGAKGARLGCIDEVTAYIETQEKDFETWDRLDKMFRDYESEVDIKGFMGAVERGAGALALKSAVVKKAAEKGRPISLRWGSEGLAVNASAFFSEIAGELAKQDGAKFGAVYFQREDGKWQFSLRCGPDFDVSRLAVSYGGGGHPQAAGFEINDLREVGL
jgi:hypothetical protein